MDSIGELNVIHKLGWLPGQLANNGIMRIMPNGELHVVDLDAPSWDVMKFATPQLALEWAHGLSPELAEGLTLG